MNFSKAIVKNKTTGEEVGIFENIVINTFEGVHSINQQDTNAHIISFKDVSIKEFSKEYLVLNGYINYKYKRYNENTPVKIYLQ